MASLDRYVKSVFTSSFSLLLSGFRNTLEIASDSEDTKNTETEDLNPGRPLNRHTEGTEAVFAYGLDAPP